MKSEEPCEEALLGQGFPVQASSCRATIARIGESWPFPLGKSLPPATAEAA